MTHHLSPPVSRFARHIPSMNSPGVRIGNGVSLRTFGRWKSRVFHVMSASGFARNAHARIGASLVGSSTRARRTSESGGSGATSGGMRRKEAHPSFSRGNFTGMFRSASSIICGETTGINSCAKHAARMTPAAPVGELSPASKALVSRKIRHFVGILFAPDRVSRRLDGVHNRLFRVGCDHFTLDFFRQGKICVNFETLDFTLQTGELVEDLNGRSLGIHTLILYAFFLFCQSNVTGFAFVTTSKSPPSEGLVRLASTDEAVLGRGVFTQQPRRPLHVAGEVNDVVMDIHTIF